MKALVIGEKVSEGIMDYVHGGGTYTRRLFIEELSGLTITVEGERVYVYVSKRIDRDFDVLGEIEVPDWLMEMAFKHALAQKSLDVTEPFISRLIKEGSKK